MNKHPSTSAKALSATAPMVSYEHGLAFDRFVRAGGRFGVYAKPVLFTHETKKSFAAANIRRSDPHDVSRLAPFENTAFVVDLPGTASLDVAMALAAEGVGPVPLYNGVPGPTSLSVVQTSELERALLELAEKIHTLPIGEDATPAFLLDANRIARKPSPGWYDNRWLVFPQDLPSGAMLLREGITRVVVVASRGRIADDLAHVLFAWQRAGLEARFTTEDLASPKPLDVTKPSGFRRTWRRALAVLGLRENAAGGFGGTVPEPSSGGG